MGRRLGPGFDAGDGPIAVDRPVVHALVGMPLGLTARLLGPERRAWVLPVTVLVVLAALLFLRAWLGQLA